ncbi:MAG: 3-phosphoshikimate 1-carboxyvinyltransferase, partial [Kiritimatiellia bacterium]|nr:3-phosphoshikimate 1-carboxyvinyltransferase [Kiritimatiellia bacterium]
VPGDKSVSHRVAMLAAMARGVSTVRGFLRSEDCLNTLRAMAALGASFHFDDSGELRIEGRGGELRTPRATLDLGNSGTGIRLLTGLLAGCPLTAVLSGDTSLCSRPMGRIAEPLRRMGARIELTGERGTAPIRMQGGRLRGIDYTLPMASAQVKSAILLAGLHAEGCTRIVEPLPTRDHTERMLVSLGIPVRVHGLTVELDGFGEAGPGHGAGEWDVPGDFSSAAFWLVAAAARPGAEVILRGVGLNPRRTALLDVLRRMGADLRVEPTGVGDAGEPRGDIVARGSLLRGTEIGGTEIPNLIDELPVAAVAAALAEGETVIRDAAELRVKESDRIASTVGNLRLLGVDAEALPDGMRIRGPARIRGGAVLESFGDHRIAMSMAVLAATGQEPTQIRSVACIETSYPGFRRDFEKMGGRIES